MHIFNIGNTSDICLRFLFVFERLSGCKKVNVLSCSSDNKHMSFLKIEVFSSFLYDKKARKRMNKN